MKKIIYIPIDERPCNYDYVENNFSKLEDIKLIIPNKSILGYKKIPANINLVHQFIEKEINNDSIIVLSLDMYIYGGLCPSRLHYFSKEQIFSNFEYLKNIKKQFPNLKIYAFSSVMRNPKYSSNDEEPDYYQHFGEEIHRLEYLLDKKELIGINDNEINELKNIYIPKIIKNDYDLRREKNINSNIKLIDLLEEGIFEELIFPQDDSSQYGYTRKDQLKLKHRIDKLGNNDKDKIHIYPGLDEVGISLVAKAINNIRKIKLNVSYIYSTKNGKNIIPNYEDREMEKTLKLHFKLFNINIKNYKDSNFVVFINSPSEKTFEAWDDLNNGIEKNHHIEFINKIDQAINFDHKKVIIVDSAYTNGSDKALIKLLDSKNLLQKVESYMGWNTNANSLGSALATGLVKRDVDTILKNVAYHIIEDYIYQSNLRIKITKNVLSNYEELNYFTLKNKANEIIKKEKKLIEKEMTKINFFKHFELKDFNIYHPWNRMFEIGIKMEEK